MKKVLISATIIAATVVACNSGSDQKKSEKDEKAKTETKKQDETDPVAKQAKAYFKQLPKPASFDRPIAKLGKKLYYETDVSLSGDMSCNSCHMLDNYGVDNEPTSPGHDGTRGERNSPSVYNAYFHIAQFWDGRAADLKEQAKGPVLNPIEMGMKSKKDVESVLGDNEEYKKMFAEAFPDDKKPINFDNMAEAIAEFEKTLATPAPFDDYLGGKSDALSSAQKEGLQTFIETGCTTCHMGPGLGGQMYQKFGLVEGPYWEYTGSEHKDEGRFDATGNEGDKYFFKVPALRNVHKTAPYFHDGSVADLDEAIKIMGKTQLGKDLTDEQVASISTFLKSLTGEIPEHALQSEPATASM
ncbi:MAG: cytochrome-c peroxidase [Salibacter sp.]|uniref:cytochrome-c peroxidase n=1 Tax=Salibacter sp. TaxID=2010995 RepID=UPI00286FE67C|nr:cytochrome-c peroxidase [Salibacter sp.]MDR9398063.1 cytochrome-c peroxidase [Salibacter sp.]